jgi:putative heme-binding domain-containing protein
MRLWWLSSAFCLLLPALFVAGQSKDKPKWEKSPHIAASDPLRPEQQVRKFRLPPGFEIQLVAADPDIRKPINIAFDASGRLWLTETIEYPFPAAAGKGRDAVKILDDFGPDGKARKITTFADGLNIPIGVLPLGQDDALVYSIPSITRYHDRERKVVLTGYGFNDTHGMTGEFVRGFDGWVYACHGFSNTSVVKNALGQPTITMQSGNTYRFAPDGGQIEYFTHGQVNPFGLSFDPLGNLYSCDCHTQPLYQLLRGAWYPSFGAPHDGLGFGPETITSYPESTAIAGITYYAADQYPSAFRDCVFIGDVVTNRVNQFRLSWHGSSSSAKLERFLQCDDPWFRPVDVKLGPDGCLYVADFYNRIIGHYELPLNHPGRDRDKGRIWRIVYRGQDGKQQPKPYQDLTRLNAATLVKELDNPNLAVRLHATDELVKRGEDAATAVRAILKQGSAHQKAHGLWVLHRLPRANGALDTATVAAAAKDKEAIVRVHAQRVLTERGKLNPPERELVLSGIKDVDPFVQRCAAEALGAHPEPANITPLLELRQRAQADDTHLVHAVRMALRDQLQGDTSVAAFARVSQLGAKDQQAIADVCPGVHNEEAGNFLLGYLGRADTHGADYQRYTHTVVRYAKPVGVAQMIDLIAARFSGNLGAQAGLLKIVQQASQERGLNLGAKEMAYAERVVHGLLTASNADLVKNGIELAGAFKVVTAQPALLALARDALAPEPVRRSAVTTAVYIDPARAVKELGQILRDEKQSIALREQLATALSGTNRPDAHAALLQVLESAPAQLQSAIAQGLAGSPQGGEKLLEAIAKGKASPRLLQARPVELRLQQAKLPNLPQRLAKLTAGLPPADQRIAELIARRRDGYVSSKASAASGMKVYEKHCAACHQLGGKGAKIGPQLDGVGIRGPERLLEDMLDPNRNVDQAFRSTTLVLENGQFVSGLVLREEGQVIVLADAQGKEQRVQKSAVAERNVSQLSPMPGNFAEQIAETELYDLLAYLLAQRAKE